MKTETFCSTEAIPADFAAMQRFHLAASKDTGRPVWLRRWHRQQADYCRRHDLTWSWTLTCYKAAQRLQRRF
jgi:hypothetical protein